MLVRLNSEAVSKQAHEQQMHTLSERCSVNLSRQQPRHRPTHSSDIPKSFLKIHKVTPEKKKEHVVLSWHQFQGLYPCGGCGDGCTWVCLTACVPQVQSYCCGDAGDSHVDTDTLLLIKPLINMSGLLCCILHCLNYT